MTKSHIVKNTTITVTEMENCTDMAVPIFLRGTPLEFVTAKILTLCSNTVLIGLENWKYWTIVKV